VPGDLGAPDQPDVNDISRTNEVVDRASRLTAEELVALGAATSPLALGAFRPKSEWTAALESASAAAETVAMSPMVEAMQAAALAAVISSALSLAEANAKRSAPARAAFDEWRRSVDGRSPRRSQRAFARMQRALLRALGYRVHRRLKGAVFGTAAAVTAVATWDLAGADGDYVAAA